jgi:hypothetical protein
MLKSTCSKTKRWPILSILDDFWSIKPLNQTIISTSDILVLGSSPKLDFFVMMGPIKDACHKIFFSKLWGSPQLINMNKNNTITCTNTSMQVIIGIKGTTFRHNQYLICIAINGCFKLILKLLDELVHQSF